MIGCEWSQKTWHLSCDGHSWTGVVGNCSQPGKYIDEINSYEKNTYMIQNCNTFLIQKRFVLFGTIM